MFISYFTVTKTLKHPLDFLKMGQIIGCGRKGIRLAFLSWNQNWEICCSSSTFCDSQVSSYRRSQSLMIKERLGVLISYSNKTQAIVCFIPIAFVRTTEHKCTVLSRQLKWFLKTWNTFLCEHLGFSCERCNSEIVTYHMRDLYKVIILRS